MTAAPEDLTAETQSNIKEEHQEEAPSNEPVEIIGKLYKTFPFI